LHDKQRQASDVVYKGEFQNMPNIKEIADGGSNPNTPTVAQMRKSQAAGSTGQGTSELTFAEKNAIRNQGTGKGEGSDPKFPDAGEYASGNGF
jgi:hypothetical protein